MTQPAGRPRSRFESVSPLLMRLSALALIAWGGWYLWTQWVVNLLGRLDPASPALLAGFGFLTGLSTFFSPCAFSLFPGYIAYYMAFTSTGGRPAHLSSLRLGSVCAAGAVSFFLIIGIGLSAFGGSLSSFLIKAKPILALGIALLGVPLLLDRQLRLPFVQAMIPTISHANPGHGPWKGIFLYGFVYGLASTGCTLPVYMSAVIFPILSGHAWAGLLTFLSFALAMGLMMLIITVLVGLSQQTLIVRLQGSSVTIKRIGGIVLILVGLYAGYYYLTAGM